MAIKYEPRKEPHVLYPLSAEECSCFGWYDPPITTGVMSVRGPDGLRVIPTRQQKRDGSFIYGEIHTNEPPPGISDEDWDLEFHLHSNCEYRVS